MDREILFRAKMIDTNEWVEGIYIPCPNSPNKPRCYILSVGTAKWYEIDPETVCQYTGLTDKNGKKIFDSDIVKLYIAYVGGSFREYTCVVYFDKFGVTFQDVKNKNNCLSYGEDVGESDISIIGNIFDNPELLNN